MGRNTSFKDDKHPMRHVGESLELDHDQVHGPFSFLRPTQARYNHIHPDDVASDSTKDEAPSKEKKEPGMPASEVAFNWTSRNNRKGRHALVVKPASPNDPNARYDAPEPTNRPRHILKIIWKMLVYYPVWDVSWWVAWMFTFGSVIWVINGFFNFLPDVRPSTMFKDEGYTAGGVTAFIGATVFEIGSILLMIEAVNENRTSCFGWAVEKALNEDNKEVIRIRADKDKCEHHHQNRRNFVGNGRKSVSKEVEDERAGWTWWPTKEEIRTKYLHSLGFIAGFVQWCAATIFWIAGITALPGIYNNLNTTAKLDGAYWVPQIIGGFGFIVSGTLYMIEPQKHWYWPAFDVLGWYIGFFNMIGGWGFFLCPIFGLYPALSYQASCSTFWGSWAFLIGSAIQLYESLDKNPVSVDKKLGSNDAAGDAAQDSGDSTKSEA